MKKQILTILGATGTIGVNTLDVLARHPERFEVFALTGATQVDKLFQQCLQFRPRYAGSLNYESLTQLANGLKLFAETMPGDRPLIDIIERDYAQALGQTVKGLAPSRALLVIDQVGLSEGDYIDIGTPLMDVRVVPLSVKTLIFYH